MGFMANIDKDLPRKDMKMLRPEHIKIDLTHNVRGYIGNEPDAPANIKADFEALVESVIDFNGIWPWNPLAVRSDGEAGWIRKGYRRLAAVLEANKRGCNIVGVPCVPDVVSKDPTHDILSQLAANENAATLRPVDEAFAYQRLLDAGMTVDAIATARRASPAVIKDRLALLNLTSETRAAVAGELIPLSRAAKMGKAKSAKDNPLTDAQEKEEVAEIMANTIQTRGSGKPRLARGTKPAPKKKDDHAPDCVRMAVYSERQGTWLTPGRITGAASVSTRMDAVFG